MGSIYENSWHIGVPDLKEYHLTHHHYVCKCGYTKRFLLEYSRDEFPFIKCPQCGNTHYLDLSTVQNIDRTYYFKEFQWSYEVGEDKEKYFIHFFYHTPVLHSSFTKFVAQKMTLQTYMLYKDGTKQTQFDATPLLKSHIFAKNNEVIEKMLKKEYIQPLLSYILQHLPPELSWFDINKLPIRNTQERFDAITVLFANRHFQDEKLCLWNFFGMEEIKEHINTQEDGLAWVLANQTKKSVIKTLYSTYENRTTTQYYPKSDALFCRIFSDENFLVSLLKLEKKEYLFDRFDFEKMLQILTFLQQHYTQKELHKMLCDVVTKKEKYEFFQDTLRMLHGYHRFEETLGIYSNHFVRVRANLQALHDEVARINRRYITAISYKDIDIEEPFVYEGRFAQCFPETMEHLEFRLPYNAEELYGWADRLQNCMASYVYSIKKEQRYIVGVFYDDKLLYALEIERYSIIQAKAKYNKTIPKEDMETIRRWLNAKKMAQWSKKSA